MRFMRRKKGERRRVSFAPGSRTGRRSAAQGRIETLLRGCGSGMRDTSDDSALDVEFQCTEAQETAILHETTPNSLLNIVSGPGTGKTKTLCNRVACLLSRGIKPSEIIIFSLTNNSVKDFRKSLVSVIGEELAARIQISTIHSYANSLILNRSPYWDVIREEKNVSHSTLKHLIDEISAYKTPGIRSLHPDLADIDTLPLITGRQLNSLKTENSELYRKYLHVVFSEKFVKINDFNIIFDKMILEATIMVWINNYALKNDTEQSAISVPPGFEIPTSSLNLKEIIVDEFQDLSGLLLDFILELSNNKQLTIAGDIDQSLYGFNDATPDKNITHIVQLYKEEKRDLKEVVLDRTFRFSKSIHKFSLNLLAAKDSCIKMAVHEKNIPVVREVFKDLGNEFEFIYDEIHRLIKNSNGLLGPENFAILASVNKVLDNLQTYFQNKGSCYKVKRKTGSQPWTDTKLSSVISFLKVLDNPHNDPSMLITISFLSGFGTQTSIYMKKRAEEEGISIYECINKDERTKKRLGASRLDKLNAILANVNRKDPASIIHNLAELSELFSFSKRLKTDSLFNNYKEFLKELYVNLNVISKIEGPNTDILSYFLSNYQSDFFKEADLDKTTTKIEDDKYITLSTIHGAKGLEWDIVFVVSGLSDASAERFVQNSRVNYVAATRAKHLLYFNKSWYDTLPYIDSLDQKNISRSNVKVHYENTIVDYIPELKKLAIPNDLKELPRYAKPLGQTDSAYFQALLHNIKSRSQNLEKGKFLMLNSSRSMSTFAKLTRLL